MLLISDWADVGFWDARSVKVTQSLEEMGSGHTFGQLPLTALLCSTCWGHGVLLLSSFGFVGYVMQRRR